VQEKLGVALEGFDLLLSEGLLISNDVFLTLIHFTARLLVLEAFLG
jgi:hypothetical protein